MIKQLNFSDLPMAVDVVRASFATVAEEFGLTEENCPRHTGFAVNLTKLEAHFHAGALMYGLFDNGQLVGYVALTKTNDSDFNAFSLNNLAVLPEYRHKGYGKQLLDFCKDRVKELRGGRIEISLNADSTVLKNWYIANGFTLVDKTRLEAFPFDIGFMIYPIV